MQNSQNFSRGNTPDPIFGEGKVWESLNNKMIQITTSLFLFSENVLKLSYSNAELKKISGVIPLDPHLRGRESCLLLKLCLTTPLLIRFKNSRP